MKIDELLSELEKYIGKDGRVPKELFFFISKNFGECCLELCIFKGDRIFLIPRDGDDPFWARKLHVPGVRKIVTDNDFTVLQRVVRETGLNINIDDIKYCSSQVLKNYRGTEFSDLRWVEYEGDFEEGFYDIYNLPNDIIEFQFPLIESAIRCRWRYKNG